jgi:hypothetical protein
MNSASPESITMDVMPSHSGRTALGFWIPLAGLVAIFGYLLIYHYHHERQDNAAHMGDFGTFYQAAQFAMEGRDIYTAGKPAQKYVYPPLVAFLYTPLTRLSMLHAAEVALLINALVLIGSVLLAARAMGQRLDPAGAGAFLLVALLVSLLNENELRLQLTMLETDGLMLLMFTLALWWLDRRPALAGMALAFAFNIKYLPIVVLPYLLLRRRWKTAAGMVLGSIFFALLPAILLGWREDLRCLRVSFGGLLKWVGVAPASPGAIQIHGIGDMLSLSITSALGRLLEPYGFSGAAIMAVAGGVGLVALVVVAWIYRAHGVSLWRSPGRTARAKPPNAGLVALEWAGLMTVALAFSPDTNARHLLLNVIVNTAGVVLLLMPQPPASRLRLVAALLIIFLSAIMPIHAWRGDFFRYGIPCFGLLAGYLMILWTGLDREIQRHHVTTEGAEQTVIPK